MAEVKSTQTTNIAAGYKNLPATGGVGTVRPFYAKFHNGASTVAVSDTIYLGDLPKGARICKDWRLNCSAGTATSTLHVGLRSKATGTVIDADGLAVSVDIAAAGYKVVDGGALLAAGEEYVTTEAVEVYGTINVAVLAASQKITLEGSFVQD
jgi:hypothetical protein